MEDRGSSTRYVAIILYLRRQFRRRSIDEEPLTTIGQFFPSQSVLNIYANQAIRHTHCTSHTANSAPVARLYREFVPSEGLR